MILIGVLLEQPVIQRHNNGLIVRESENLTAFYFYIYYYFNLTHFKYGILIGKRNVLTDLIIIIQ